MNRRKEYGLVSRGGDDTRLRDNEQERQAFFQEIQDKYEQKTWSLDNVLFQLRKLREALLPLAIDELRRDVYLYSVKRTVESPDKQKQHILGPLLETLLDDIHPVVPLGSSDLQLVVKLSIYRLALEVSATSCESLNLAYKSANEYCTTTDYNIVWTTLQSIAVGNYAVFRQCIEQEQELNPTVGHFLKTHDMYMVNCALKGIGKAYKTLSQSAFEEWVGRPFSLISCSWTLEGSTIKF